MEDGRREETLARALDQPLAFSAGREPFNDSNPWLLAERLVFAAPEDLGEVDAASQRTP